MTMFSDVIVNMSEIIALPRDAAIREDVMARGARVAARARTMAPVHTGAGAASINTEAVMTAFGWCCDISWDRAHAYMRYTDMGTRYIPAQHYLERALEQGG